VCRVAWSGQYNAAVSSCVNEGSHSFTWLAYDTSRVSVCVYTGMLSVSVVRHSGANGVGTVWEDNQSTAKVPVYNIN